MKPRLIQRVAPFEFVPITSTSSSSTVAAARISQLHFSYQRYGTRLTSSITTVPSAAKTSWLVKYRAEFPVR